MIDIISDNKYLFIEIPNLLSFLMQNQSLQKFIQTVTMFAIVVKQKICHPSISTGCF